MVPDQLLDQANDQHRLQFFQRIDTPSGMVGWWIRQQNTGSSSSRQGSSSQQQQPPTSTHLDGKATTTTGVVTVVPSQDPIASLTEVIRAETHRKKKYPPSETGNSPQNYDLFVDLIYRMLSYDPKGRINPDAAMKHPFLSGSG
jgi:serine/threonine protein kinase